MAFGDFTVDRNSTKYVLGSGGTIIPSATDEPAFEFNADGSYKGLLVEPAATNLLTYSEDFTQWVNDNSTDSLASSVDAPDGTESATHLVPNAGTPVDTPVIYVLATQTEEVRTLSCFMKSAEYTKGFLRVGGNTTGDDVPTAIFDLSSGSVIESQGIGVTATIVPYANGWYRCVLTYNNGNGTPVGTGEGYAPNVGCVSDTYTLNTSTVTTDTDGTSGIYIWGAQLEAGPIATSYIPTTTGQVNRVKDDITLGSASSLIGQTEGTLYLEVDWRYATGTFQVLLEANDGTTNNRILFVTVPPELRMYAQVNGVLIVNQGVSSSGFSGIQKIALAYANGDQELYRNGSSVSTATGSLASLATLTDIDIGQRFDADYQANMWIRAVALYPKRLSDAECQALTTL